MDFFQSALNKLPNLLPLVVWHDAVSHFYHNFQFYLFTHISLWTYFLRPWLNLFNEKPYILTPVCLLTGATEYMNGKYAYGSCSYDTKLYELSTLLPALHVDIFISHSHLLAMIKTDKLFSNTNICCGQFQFTCASKSHDGKCYIWQKALIAI